jgi:putative DNA primase/helicase
LDQVQAPPQRFALLDARDLLSMAPQRWVVRNLLPDRGIASLFGASGSGKTFLALDLMIAIAEGAGWFGHATQVSPVLYCALEGEFGIGKRVRAWSLKNGRTLPAGVRFMVQPLDIRADADELAACIARAGGARVVFVDTLNRAAPGMDENDSAEMGRFIEAVMRLQCRIGGLVVLVAHTGKDESRGLRGHSSLRAALDAAIEVRRNGDAREWRAYKVKDGRDDDVHPFALEVIELGHDADGVPTSSCVVVARRPEAGSPVRRQPTGRNQKAALCALRKLAGESPSVDHAAGVRAIADRLMCPAGRRVERAKEALAGLTAGGLVDQQDGKLWLP